MDQKETTMKFYIARNTLAITKPMTKKAALALWEQNKVTGGTDRYQLCKETGNMATFTPVMDLN